MLYRFVFFVVFSCLQKSLDAFPGKNGPDGMLLTFSTPACLGLIDDHLGKFDSLLIFARLNKDYYQVMNSEAVLSGVVAPRLCRKLSQILYSQNDLPWTVLPPVIKTWSRRSLHALHSTVTSSQDTQKNEKLCLLGEMYAFFCYAQSKKITGACEVLGNRSFIENSFIRVTDDQAYFLRGIVNLSRILPKNAEDPVQVAPGVRKEFKNRIECLQESYEKLVYLLKADDYFQEIRKEIKLNDFYPDFQSLDDEFNILSAALEMGYVNKVVNVIKNLTPEGWRRMNDCPLPLLNHALKTKHINTSLHMIKLMPVDQLMLFDYEDESPLSRAYSMKLRSCVLKLIAKISFKLDDSRPFRVWKTFYDALSDGEEQIAMKFIEKLDPYTLAIANKEGKTPFFIALEKNLVKCALAITAKLSNDQLLKVDSQDKNYLSYAQDFGRTDIYNTLLKRVIGVVDEDINLPLPNYFSD